MSEIPSNVKVVIVTTTFYKSPEELRFNLACETIAKAQKAGYPIVVVDGSPDPAIRKKMAELGALVYPEVCRGIGPSRRQSFFHSLDVFLWDMLLWSSEYFCIDVWTEPEKTGIIEHIPKIIKPIIDDQAVIVIPSRTEKSWETYPAFQRDSEMKANRAYREATGWQDADPMFGPGAFLVNNLQILAALTAFNPRRISGVEDTYHQHWIPIILGSKPASVPVDFVYPPEQKEAEEKADNEAIRQKRDWQRDSLIRAYGELARRFL